MRAAPRFVPAALWAGALLLSLAATAVAQEPTRLPLDPEVLARGDEAWYGVYAAGTKIGFLRAGYAPSGDSDRPLLVFDMQAEMKVKALGQKVDIEMAEEVVFSGRPPYALLHGQSSMSQGPFTRAVEVRADGGVLTASITEAGSVREMDLGPVDYTAEDALTPDAWFERPREEGDILVARSFAILELQESLDTYEVESRRESLADGVPVIYYEVRQRSSTLGEVGTFRYDAGGRLLSGVLGGALEIRLESEDLARDADHEADLFVLGMAAVDRPLGDARDVESLVLRVTSDAEPDVPDGPRQSTERNGEGALLVRLGERWGRPAPGPADVQEHLGETLDYPTERAEVRALLRSVLGDGEHTPWSKVEALVSFVQGFIEDSYTAQPLTVMDILQVRRGDCTEHALLFATLARAAGIPTREVGGLIYMGDAQQAFGGHAWNEVLIDGGWIPVDPLWGETDINATHISFGPLTGEDAGLFTLLGGYSFAVESLRHRHETPR